MAAEKKPSSSRSCEGKQACPSTLEDTPIGQIIKIDYDPPAKPLVEYLPDTNVAAVTCGRTGCGKTFLLRVLLPQIPNLSQILWCSRVTVGSAQKVQEHVKAWCDETGKQYVFASTPEEADAGLQSLVASKPEGTIGLIVMDDWSNYKKSDKCPFNGFANLASSMMRNYGYWSFYCTQQYSNIPPPVRINANVVITFTQNEPTSERLVRDAMIRMGCFNSPEQFDKYYSMVKVVPHAYLLASSGSKQEAFIHLDDKVFLERIDSAESEIEGDEIIQRLVEEYKSFPRDSGMTMSRIRKDKVRHKIEIAINNLASEYAAKKTDVPQLVSKLRAKLEKKYDFTL